jgi:hypothetical protein
MKIEMLAPAVRQSRWLRLGRSRCLPGAKPEFIAALDRAWPLSTKFRALAHRLSQDEIRHFLARVQPEKWEVAR